jgi:hypothetical protein
MRSQDTLGTSVSRLANVVGVGADRINLKLIT